MNRAHTVFELLRWWGRWCGPASDAAPPTIPPPPSPPEPEDEAFLVSRQLDSLAALAWGDDGRQAAYDRIWAAQSDAAVEVVGALVAQGVDALTFKGGELVRRCGRGHALGFMGDVDVLVPMAQLDETKAVLYRLGYRQSAVDDGGALRYRGVREAAQVELVHYELAPFLRTVEVPAEGAMAQVAARHPRSLLPTPAGGFDLVLEIDVHHNVATDTTPDALFGRAVSGSLGVGRTFSDADHVWFNLSRFYNEVGVHGKTTLRPLAYTLPVLAQGAVDWDVVVAMADELRLGPTLYYPLMICEKLVEGSVPPGVAEKVWASSPTRIRDWGWQLPKLLDLPDPFPDQLFET